ncbi:MAG: sensor histidine kinase [Oscillospiraceae bacterium]|nr:sensor histidine kinase [Oscillospiraceae bacterium]
MDAEKKQNVKMRSIARKISADFNFRLLVIFLVLDAVVVFLNVGSWMVLTELDALGMSIIDAAKTSLDIKIPAGHFVFPHESDPVEFLNKICYYVPQIKKTVPAANIAVESISIAGLMLFLEMFWVITGFFRGGSRVRKKLAPLNRLAATAQLISSANFEGDSFHALEDALEKIDASQTDCHLSTGNTELQGIESAINNLIDRMKQSYVQQARFVSDASHELRTPISVIQGYANMLDRWGKEDEKVLEESISAIKTESESMSKLVEQLLFLARGDNGKNQLTMEDIDLSAMMQELYDEYLMVDPAHEFILKNEGGPVMAYGDYAMIKQTARILTDNAVKYTPEGNEIYFSAYTDEKGTPVFEVQDTGIGIAPEDLPKVFERFYRADDARNRKTGGTGLGLSIAKWIVDRHGGHFDIKSYPDAGTRFSVFLPVKNPEGK